jgi:hypothetical protein
VFAFYLFFLTADPIVIEFIIIIVVVVIVVVVVVVVLLILILNTINIGINYR